MNTEDYVSYPIAKQFKAAGFNEPCDHYYCAFDNETDVRFWSIHPAQSQNGLRTPNDTVVADAPTLWQAQKWLRSKGIEVYVLLATDNDEYEWSIYDRNVRDNIDSNHGDDYKTYESALSAGIARALELIKKGE